MLELRNDYFKVTFSENPQVKHSQLAHSIVVLTNYNMSFAMFLQKVCVDSTQAGFADVFVTGRTIFFSEK